MNANKFNFKGNVYAKARPKYPVALFWYLLSERIVSKDKVIADIGSGTGIFTGQLSEYAKTVFAVEPNGDMREKAEESFRNYTNIVSVNATAENTTLPDGSVDIITVAQAFHWFDRNTFKTECQRILKPNGKIILLWNDRDISSKIIKDNFEVNKKYCPEFKGSSNGIDFSKEAFIDFFEGEFDIIEFDNSLIYDMDAFISRNLSSSYAPRQQDDCYEEYVEELKAVFNKHSKDRTVKYPYITRCYIGKMHIV